jgi:hypothetical protein
MTNGMNHLILGLLLTFFMSSAFANNMDEFSCLKGSKSDQSEYKHAVSLYKKEYRNLSIQEQNLVITSVDRAVKNKCKQAAVIRFYLEIYDLGGAAKLLDDKSYRNYEKTLYRLIGKANELNEGWFELGTLKMNGNGKYYSPSEAQMAFEKAALTGDDRAMNQLISIYTMGKDGIDVDEKRAKYWQEKLDMIRSNSVRRNP